MSDNELLIGSISVFFSSASIISRCVDLRTGAFDVPPQEILTRDSVTVSVDAVVYYQVSNPLAAICNNDDYNRSTRLLAATTLRYYNTCKNSIRASRVFH